MCEWVEVIVVNELEGLVLKLRIFWFEDLGYLVLWWGE